MLETVFDSALPADIAWPAVLFFAWVAGEFVHRATRLPRICTYAVIGFLTGFSQFGLLPKSDAPTMTLLATLAFGLILFEFGYRINLRWLLVNRWIGVTSVLEAMGTFAVTLGIARLFGMPFMLSLLLAALCMSTSPAALMRVVNEEHSAGQVTERALHLSAFNCILGVLMFKIVMGFWIFQTFGSLGFAFWNSLVLLAVSSGLGILFGLGVPGLLRLQGRIGQDSTVAFGIAVALLVILTQSFKLSAIIAALVFGITARHRRIVFNRTQKNFGTLGDFLTLFLFVYVASSLEWRNAIWGVGLAITLITARFVVKTGIITLLSGVSGMNWKKGVYTGMALTPMSVFAILLLGHTRSLGINLIDDLMPLTAMTLILEIAGPILTQKALVLANEARHREEV